MKLLVLGVAAFISFAAGGAELSAASPVTSASAPVGMRSVRFEDPTRDNWAGTGKRPLQTVIWYPAAAGTVTKPWNVAIFLAGNNAIGAPLAETPAKLPLIVLSHGTGGSAAAVAWLAEGLAAGGYIVAAVNHHGNTAAEEDKRLEGTVIWWDRPKDITVVIDRLLADATFGPRIDSNRIGVAGFSLGGYTALATVGARLSQQQLLDACAAPETAANCKLPPEAREKFSEADLQRLVNTDARVKAALQHMDDSYADPRIKAAFVMAPVFGFAMTKESLAAVKVPVRLMVGSADVQAVPSQSVEPIARQVPGASLEVIPSASHYIFAPLCNETGLRYVKDLCVDGGGVDRASVHQQVITEALAFFRASLSRPLNTPP